jgi:two-component sensor histidine kinase
MSEFQTRFSERLHAMARAQDLLVARNWEGAQLTDLVRSQMAPFTEDVSARIEMKGPEIELRPDAVHSLTLALHELATNAAKYGALSNPDGRVHVAWSVVKGDGTDFLRFRWEEHGGPPVAQPARRGFGSAVLEQVMGEYVENPPLIDFAPGGIRYELSGPLDALTPARR